MLKIAIFCGGQSSEHDVSLSSSKTIYKFIDKKKYKVYFFFISKDNKSKLILGKENINFNEYIPKNSLIEGLYELKKRKFFALLAGIHGGFAENGGMQTLLEYLKIPYSGSGPLSSSLCMDKFRSMMLVNTLKGITLPKTVFYEKEVGEITKLVFPLFVKPNSLGSSVGSFKVTNKQELQDAIFDIKNKIGEEEILIQEYIEGIELSCGVLENDQKKLLYLPPIEIHPKKSEDFDYSSKYDAEGSEEITPPISISAKTAEKISILTGKIHKLLGCKTYSRSDFKFFNGKLFYLETNTLPGMTSTSLLPKEAIAKGMSFSNLLDFIISN